MLTEERLEQLQSLWWEETNEDWTQEWRDSLTPEEQATVEGWDSHYCDGVLKMCQEIVKKENQG